MWIQNEFIKTFTIIETIKLLIVSLINNCLFLGSSPLLYKNKPYINPEIAALTVKPGKYAPNGNKIAPKKSPNNAIIVLYLGPNQIADIIIGIKLMLITNICVFIDTNLDNIINIANNIADNIIFFILDIKKSPFFIIHAIKKEDFNFFFWFFIAECENK